MRYVCLAYGDEAKSRALSAKEIDALVARCRDYDAELRSTGRLVSGLSLDWASTTLRARGGKVSVTDGPFAETKEVVGGLVVIDADDREHAIRLASLHPAARMGEELGWWLELRAVDDAPICRPDGSGGA